MKSLSAIDPSFRFLNHESSLSGTSDHSQAFTTRVGSRWSFPTAGSQHGRGNAVTFKFPYILMLFTFSRQFYFCLFYLFIFFIYFLSFINPIRCTHVNIPSKVLATEYRTGSWHHASSLFTIVRKVSSANKPNWVIVLPRSDGFSDARYLPRLK